MSPQTSPAAASAGNSAERFFEFSLLAMLGSGYCAVLGSGELDWPAAVLMPAVLLVRALMACGRLRLDIPAWLVAAVTVAYVVYYPLDYLYVSESFLTATVHLIFFVAGIKILTARTPRDFNFVKLIAGMELMAAALLSVNLNFFVFLALFLLATIATFASGEVLRSTRTLAEGAPAQARVSTRNAGALPRRLAALSAVLFCGIFIITAGIFFVLPRTARAALQRFVPQRYHIPGFASEVTLGDIGEIKQRTTPVMHIHSDDGLDLTGLRWRGAGLSRFDGTRWFNPQAPEQRLYVDDTGRLVLPAVRFTRPGYTLTYEVQLNEIAPDTLFFAGTPQTIGIPVPALWRSASGSLRAPRYSLSGLRYRARSYLEYESAPPNELPEPLDPAERVALLELPPLDPRIAALAQSWTADFVAPDDKARILESRLRRDYGYSLRLLEESVPDPLAHFLFVRKEGHCEYFASALAVMLRSVGIPSRVATGFLSGVYNPISGWQVIRASDAHSWVEAWMPDRGWITLDPTPPDPSAAAPGLWSKMVLYLDAADQFWTDWIVGYDFEHQVVLASRMQSGGRRIRFAWMDQTGAWLKAGADAGRGWMVGVIALAGFSVIAVLYGPAWARWWQRRARLRRAQRGVAEASDATLLYERMLQVLDRRGFRKPPWLTPAEFARVLPASELALLVDDLTTAYNQVRFGGRNDAAPRMALVLQRIESLAAK
jgi:transglutaminase-like putative cysteine protease